MDSERLFGDGLDRPGQDKTQEELFPPQALRLLNRDSTWPPCVRLCYIFKLYCTIKVVQTSGHCLSLARKKTMAVWISTAWKEFYVNGYRWLYSYTLTSSVSIFRLHLWCLHLFFSSFWPSLLPYTPSARPLPSRPSAGLFHLKRSTPPPPPQP